MKLTLRKANAVQNEINVVLRNLTFDTTVRVNEFEGPETKLEEQRTEFNINTRQRTELMDALYEIRVAVSAANAANEVNDKLAVVARLEKDITFYTDLAKSEPVKDAEVIKGKLRQIETASSESRYGYGSRDSVDTGILTKGQIKSFKKKTADLRKAKRNLQDELLEVNVKVTIDISDQSVDTLKAESLV
jgi:hypothetical protein